MQRLVRHIADMIAGLDLTCCHSEYKSMFGFLFFDIVYSNKIRTEQCVIISLIRSTNSCVL